jgi:hypothetical protein
VRYNLDVTATRFIGVDLAWREGSAEVVANETGVAVINGDGQILDVGWTRGVEQTIGWAVTAAGGGDAVMFVDAPLTQAERAFPLGVPDERSCLGHRRIVSGLAARRHRGRRPRQRARGSPSPADQRGRQPGQINCPPATPGSSANLSPEAGVPRL